MIRKYLLLVASVITLGITLLIAAKLYTRIGAFGCFDDCHTITSAYFMTRGRQLYAEIFYNHQVLMPVFSYIIQTVVPHTDSLYQTIAIHRLAVMAVSFALGIVLILRFRWMGIMFLLIYEPVKFYVHGDRFLPESFVAYLVAYMTGLVWEKVVHGKLQPVDYYIAACMTWLVVFLREPYVPLAVILFAVILFEKHIRKIRVKPVILFFVLTGTTLALLPLRDFYETVFVLNYHAVASDEIAQKNLFGAGFIELFIYPFTVIAALPETIIGRVQIVLSAIFIAGSAYALVVKKQYLPVLCMWIILGASAIRLEPPGAQFYEAFHMIPWYAVISIFSAYFIYTFWNEYKNALIRIVLTILFLTIPIYSMAHPGAVFQENVDTIEEFNTGYGRYQAYADIIHTFADAGDTLFVDLWDDIMYVTTGLESSYDYALYTPWDKPFSPYKESVGVMYAQHPPDFYYCSNAFTYEADDLMPDAYRPSYVQLAKDKAPVCIYIHRNKLDTITEETWRQAVENGIGIYDAEDNI